ncbi:MAG: hypothetical protein Q9213_000689 [Squamulea squamosa]
MAFNHKNAKFFDTYHQYPYAQPASAAGRPTVAPSIVPTNGNYYFPPGRAPTAQMTPYGGQTQGFNMPYGHGYPSQGFGMPSGHPKEGFVNGYYTTSNSLRVDTPQGGSMNQGSLSPMSSYEQEAAKPTKHPGRDTYAPVPPLLSAYPRRIDPPPPNEPHSIPVNLALIKALHLYDKSQVDSDYMGFIVVMERIWPQFMRKILEAFCQSLGPTAVKKEYVELQVRDLMVLWTRKEAVVKSFPHEVREVRDLAHLEYERRVRCWHVERHMEEYVASAVLRLRELGYPIGG